MTALARELRSRQHDVVFISLLDTEPFVSRIAKLPFLPCCEKDLPSGAIKEVARQISLRQGHEALEFTLRSIASMTDSLLDSLPGILEKAEIDALVLDTYHFYMELVPIRLGMPYAHLSNALHFDYSGYTPLCIYDWPHECTSEALTRNRRGVASFMEILRRTTQSGPVRKAGRNRTKFGQLQHYFEAGLDYADAQGIRFRKLPLVINASSYRTVSRFRRQDERRFPMGATNRPTPHLCLDGNVTERCGQCLPRDRDSRRKTEGYATGPFHWQSRR